MRQESLALGQILLEQHKVATTQRPPHPDKKLIFSNYTIPYGQLCARAGTPHITAIVGSFLAEIAEWCAEEGWPPLNALAVNHETRIPGEGYDGAGLGLCNIVKWPSEVETCIRFNKYPRKMPAFTTIDTKEEPSKGRCKSME